ncbi:MAG: hypothetical protein CSYNP_03417 [Syntrophus sp. SKADARSKE-3]|nr:hypothetical protein [Syntrophus sp. SKADARSKE-3]
MKKSMAIGCFVWCFILLTCFLPGSLYATAPVTGESALFTSSTQPDALILLDLSGSMAWNPAGGTRIYGTPSCAADTSACSGSTYNCSGGFCDDYGKSGCSTNCSRLAIAKRALFNILDDNGDGTINSADETSLSVNMGYMRFYNCDADDTSDDYTSGCIQIPGSSSTSRRYLGTAYSRIYCGDGTSCTVDSTGSYSIGGASATGGTPLASALRKAKIYFDADKAADDAASCRKKFIIVITDGADTYSCSGSGAECQSHMYKRRQETVARAKAIADAGYKLFVVGFGAAMPDYLENTLNWMAYFGGTDNPNQTNSGSTSGYNPATVTSCATDGGAVTATCYDPSANDTANFRGTNDPGYAALSGYAFLAADANALGTALSTAIGIIRQANYSFSQSSVQSARTTDENFLYEGSFEPIDGEPFWKGHLKKYQINADGTVGSMLLDAGTVLQSTASTSRTIKTYKGGALTDFTTANITPADLGITSGTSTQNNSARDAVVGFFRGESTYNIEDWKLGDVFRSTPITVGTPSAFFDDIRDSNNAFAAHRSSHVRSSSSGNRLIVAGANDGQFHGFKTGDMTEAWSFIPPNLLTKLKNISHSTHNATAPLTSLTHQYFVDGAVTVADVWLGTGTGLAKTADWKTILVFGEGRGAVSYAWSSSTSCDTGLNATYSTTYPYYCGYWAFDLNNSLSPAYLWRLTPTAAQAPYVGDPWNKMMTGRVRISVGGAEQEKWVGFIGAGYNGSDCSGGGGCDTGGKGFFVVDLTNGTILWSYTIATDNTMNYSLPATAAIVDTDNDGFIDTAYIGDLGGNMWRFKFCRSVDMPSCTTANWTGGKFYASSSGNIRPIYTSPAVAKDTSGNLWVYWGTGDKTDPTASNAQERFFGVKDDRSTTYGFNSLQNITTAAGTYDPTSSTNVGYAINLAGSGQKMLADPTVFGGVVYFTTYTPPSGNNPCEQGGAAALFAIKTTTGAGALADSARSMSLGSGIPSAPVMSLKPGTGTTPDLFVTTSGGGGVAASTQRVDITPPGLSNRTNMLYWKDLRTQ